MAIQINVLPTSITSSLRGNLTTLAAADLVL